MKCSFCGREIDDKIPEDQLSCGRCRSGCRKVHCPYCGYANPLVPKYLQRWASNTDDPESGDKKE